MNLEEIKEKYPIGTAVKLIEMKGEPQMPKGLKGRVTDIDDIGQIHVAWENGSSLALNIEEDRFDIVSERSTLRALLIRPNEYPKVVEVEDSLAALQKAVGGRIEEYMPFDDEVAIVCNEEGKSTGLDLNRAIYDKNKEIIDIIAGDFLICYAPIESESYLSLPKSLEQKYYDIFKYPEHFIRIDEEIIAKPYKPRSKEQERH